MEDTYLLRHVIIKMKQKIKFTILILILISLFIFRNDAVKAYGYINDLIVHKYSEITGQVKSTDKTLIKDIINEKTSISTGMETLIDTPGALRVTNPIAKEGRLARANIIYITNLNREEVAHLPALKENAKLNMMAEKKVEDMFDNQYFEHISPKGVGVNDLANAQSYEYIIIGENLALGNFRNGDAVVNAWMNSPGHRANILNTKYTEIGIAVGKGLFEGKETWIIVQHFGLPKDACPVIDNTLKEKINTLQKNADKIQKDLEAQKSIIDSGEVGIGSSAQEQISKYNSGVIEYNKLVSQIKSSITNYNDEVRAFNSCVQSNT